MIEETVSILSGSTFVVSDTCGDIDASPTNPAGLFYHDTRFLSKWLLTVNGDQLSALSIDDLQYYQKRFFLVVGESAVYSNAKVSVIRERTVAEGFEERLTILNHDDAPVQLTVRIDVECDFSDIFEVKDALQKKGDYYSHFEDGSLVLGYTRSTLHRRTVIASTEPVGREGCGLSFVVRIEPQQDWSTLLRVTPITVAAAGWQVHGESIRSAEQDMSEDLQNWLERSPRLECDWDALKHTYERSLIDLAALRFTPGSYAHGIPLPAAGLPWFMAVFGRDSILTSLQALPFHPELARATLRELRARQGNRWDHFRDEEPGRILHELRMGETVAFEERPHSPYFGSADATPLFVVLLDEYERWTGDVELVRQLEYAARAALTWIDEHGDLIGNGYLSYRSRNPDTGLENQCWKDSWDSISYRDGRLPGLPRATCELQGYVYDAKLRAARLARVAWNDPVLADKLERDANNLKQRFNHDFWLDEQQYYAIGLDADGSPIDALSSNIGHLLWSGIVDPDKADSVVRHLLGPTLFSGWGVRTLATSEKRYNPIGYHVGTVWPFDNAFIAWGLRRYGYKNEAAYIAAAILQAATYFAGRLPEAFAGYERVRTGSPVRYPTACSPQAWSAGAPLLFLRTMLGLEPLGDNLLINPALPKRIGQIQLLDIPGRWGRMDAYGRGSIDIDL